MGKRKNQPLIDSDSSSSESASDLESELLSLAKKKKKSEPMGGSGGAAGAVSPNSKKSSGSDSDWAGGKNGSGPPRKKKRTKKMSKSSSESEQSDSDNDDDDDDEEDKQQKGEVLSSPGAPKQTAIQPKVEEVSPQKSSSEKEIQSEHEEGEVTSDDDSASDSSSDSEFDDGYDDNLMGDDEDRARLNALSEKERETEIFKRIERRDVMRTRWEIERKLKLARRGEKAKDKTRKDKKKKKEKKEKEREKPIVIVPPLSPKPAPKPAVAQPPAFPSPEKIKEEEPSNLSAPEYFDPKERSKERKKNVEMNKTDDKRSNAMALLKAKREGKQKREEEEAKRQAERDREEEKEELESVSGGKSSIKLKASDIYSDDSGSSESEEEKPSEKRSVGGSSSRSSSDWEDEEKTQTVKKPVYISTKEELNKLRLSRFKMERFINLPSFEKLVLNCFVRISIGNNNSKPIYRVAEIVGIVETAKIYGLGSNRTNKGMKLRHGSQERVFRLEFISNQDFTEGEYEKWRQICIATNVPLPTIDFLEAKSNEIAEAMIYEFKDEDVAKIIEEKNRFRQRPTNYAMKKTCLMKERDAALLRGDDEIARELSTQIEELESRANELDKRRTMSISLISYINDRNRKRNVEEAEKAIMEEVRASKGMKVEDPFTRRSTKPRMSFKSVQESKEEIVIAPPAPPPPGRKKPEEDKKPKPNSNEHNLYSLHDFEIDLDVPLPINPVSVLPNAVAKAPDSAPKRSLNLEDYKKKRGLI